MTVFSQSHYHGEIMLDHRCSPGLPADIAERMGLEPLTVREGAVTHMATKTCIHCNAHVVLQPLRERERASCMKCGGLYICDYCDADRRRSDYVHRPFAELVQLVGSGKFTLEGPLYKPVLIPTGD